MLTLFFAPLLLAFHTFAEAPDSPSGTTYKLDANMSYFSSSVNYKAGGGVTEDLRNGGSFTDIATRVTYTQDLDRIRRVYGGIVYSATESFDGFVERANGGFNELLAGGQYWVKSFGYKFGPSADFVYPLVRVDRGADDVLLGEGAMKLRLGSWMNWSMGAWQPFGYFGYEYRDEGRSHAVPYNLGIKLRGNSFYALGELRGFERLFSNADSENRNSREDFLQKVNGGSYRFYSLNPSGSEVAAEMGFYLGPVTVYAGGAMVVNGSSYADGWTVVGGVSFSPKATHAPGGPVDEFERINSPSEGSDDDRFTPHVDPFDEFDPTKPPRPQTPKAAPPDAPRPKAAPRRPKPAPDGTEALEEDLNTPIGPPVDSPMMDEPTPPAAPPPKAVPAKPPAPKAPPARTSPPTDIDADALEEEAKQLKLQMRPAQPRPKAVPAAPARSGLQPKTAPVKPAAPSRSAPRPKAAPAKPAVPSKSAPRPTAAPGSAKPQLPGESQPKAQSAKPANPQTATSQPEPAVEAPPPKPAAPPKPKPPKKNKVDKLLEDAEKNLKDL